MKINIFQWRYNPFLMVLALWLPIRKARTNYLLKIMCKAVLNTILRLKGTVIPNGIRYDTNIIMISQETVL